MTISISYTSTFVLPLPNWPVPARVRVIDRIIPAVREHIVSGEPLAGAGVAVRVEEPLDDGVVISGLQVIEARLFGGVGAIEAKKWSI